MSTEPEIENGAIYWLASYPKSGNTWARALIAKGVTAPDFYRVVKQTFVEVAEADFALDGERPTDSRISMLTGVHRRDVKAFRDPDMAAALQDDIAGEAMQYLRPNTVTDIVWHDENPLLIELPGSVDLEVTECQPGIKGATVTNQLKEAVQDRRRAFTQRLQPGL